MFGQGRFNAGVLIEPTEADKFDPSDEKKLAAFRNLIWYANYVGNCCRILT
jgi:hypothetical protein